MLNYIFLYLLEWLLTISPSNSRAIERDLEDDATTAQMPHLFGSTLRVNLSLIVALAMALVVWWLMQRSASASPSSDRPQPGRGQDGGHGRAAHHRPRAHDSGALIGMAGMATLSGTDFLLSTGYAATPVSTPSRWRSWPQQPRGIVLGSLLFAALISGGATCRQ